MAEWRNGGWNGGMAEWLTGMVAEWRNSKNGYQNGRPEWRNCGWNGRMAELLTGMAEWRMEWHQNCGMAGTATGMADQNGGMADGMVEWSNGGNGGNG